MANLPTDDPTSAMEWLTRIAPMYRMGISPAGAGEVELYFDNVGRAEGFARDTLEGDPEFMTPAITSARLRDPVTDLTSPCTLIARLNPDWKFLL